jgi:hypothetical protein
VKYDGREDDIVDHLLTWGNFDKKQSKESSSAQPSTLNREGYDTFMRTHLIRHTTPASNIISIQAAVKFTAQALSAKKVVAKRKLENGCESEVAFVSAGDKNKKQIELRTESGEDRDGHRVNQILDGLELMKERLCFLNLRMVEMDDDGNCQFRAISYELFGSQQHHHVVRTRIVTHLRAHSHMFSFYVGEDEEWLRYLEKMSRKQTWGDELTLTAASQAFHVNIHLITTEQCNWLLHYNDEGITNIDGKSNDSVPGNSNDGNGHDDKSEDGMQPPLAKKAKVKRDLFLMYISPIHYNVVAPPRLSAGGRHKDKDDQLLG